MRHIEIMNNKEKQFKAQAHFPPKSKHDLHTLLLWSKRGVGTSKNFFWMTQENLHKHYHPFFFKEYMFDLMFNALMFDSLVKVLSHHHYHYNHCHYHFIIIIIIIKINYYYSYRNYLYNNNNNNNNNNNYYYYYYYHQ